MDMVLRPGKEELLNTQDNSSRARKMAREDLNGKMEAFMRETS
jgi:hypothetical protein